MASFVQSGNVEEQDTGVSMCLIIVCSTVCFFLCVMPLINLIEEYLPG